MWKILLHPVNIRDFQFAKNGPKQDLISKATFQLDLTSIIQIFDKMLRMKKTYFLGLFALSVVIFSCAPKEHKVDCNQNSGNYICFDNEGRDGIYARWNFDTVQTYNAFNIQGSYAAVPGTQGDWTTINITMVTSAGNLVMETGLYNYVDWLSNEGQKEFTFYVRHFSGDAKDPDIKTFKRKVPGLTVLNITGMNGSGELTGMFTSELRNVNDPNDSSAVKFYFTDIPIQ